MLKQRLAAVLLVGAVELTACSENLAPGSANENEEERAEVIQVAEASGFFADAFGVDGVFDDVGTISSASLVAGAPAAIEVEPPRRWGRRFGLPVRRILDSRGVQGIGETRLHVPQPGHGLPGLG